MYDYLLTLCAWYVRSCGSFVDFDAISIKRKVHAYIIEVVSHAVIHIGY